MHPIQRGVALAGHFLVITESNDKTLINTSGVITRLERELMSSNSLIEQWAGLSAASRENLSYGKLISSPLFEIPFKQEIFCFLLSDFSCTIKG